MTTTIKWLFASDIHFPKHDARMVTLWMDVLRYLKPQAVDLLGDIDDADSTSRWAEGTSRASTSLEDAGVADTRKFLADIHSVVPKADKHFHDGNHGWYRHAKFLDKNAPQVLDYLTPDTLYEYRASKFEWHLYDQPPVKRYGDIYAHHGESISKHAGESVRNDVMGWGVSLIRGHSHRMGEYHVSYPLAGRDLRGFEIGHMCDPSQMTYDVAPNWQAGFAFGLVDGDDVFIDTIEIRNYKCYVGGKLFQG